MSILANRRAFVSVLVLALAGAAHGASVHVVVRDLAGQPLADAAVYATPASGAIEAKSARPAAIEQEDREFMPYVSVIQTGTAVAFPNRDPILHHVYSFSPAKPFEIKLYTGKSPREVVFDKPGVVALGCNIHDWMVGYVVVVSTPHFGRSDARGEVRLRELPAGAYELRAWHPRQRAGLAPVKLSLDAASSPTVDFVVDAVARAPKFKPPLDRLKY
jgi:plastocyanin